MYYLFQVVLPALLEQGHTKQFVKWCVKLWCRGVASMLGITSYLLGDQNDTEGAGGRPGAQENEDNAQQPRELAAVHQALINAHVPSPNVPYERTTYFPLRVNIITIISIIIIIIICLLLFNSKLSSVPSDRRTSPLRLCHSNFSECCCAHDSCVNRAMGHVNCDTKYKTS